MKKIIFFVSSVFIVIFLIFFSIRDEFRTTKILEKIKNHTNLIITLKNKNKWQVYPFLSFQNEISAYSEDKSLIIENGSLDVMRHYWITSPVEISFKSPSILYKGLDFRNSKIISNYRKKIISIKSFNADFIQGNIEINGSMHLDNSKKISLKGSYENVSLNEAMEQLNVADWKRIKINLSSPNFYLTTINSSTKELINYLNGEMDIEGSFLFISNEKERFGAMLLSLLANNISDIMPVSSSINYLLDNFSDEPSQLSGKIVIKNGILSTNKMILENKKGKALITAKVNLRENTIDGKIDFYKNNKIFFQTEISGNIQNPEILLSGKVFTENGQKLPKNIKQIFEDGIQSFIDNFLSSND